MKTKYIAPVLIAIACLGLQQAKAVSTVYSLTTPNAAISGYPAPYGSVSVTVVGTTATIVFTAAQTGAFQYLFGNGSSVDVNVQGGFTVNTITGTQLAGFTPTTYSNAGAKNVDGFGVFNLTIDGGNGYTTSSNSITFTVTQTSGTPWLADGSNVLTANANGALVAAHIFVAAFPADPNASALATGYAANGGAVNTPDGGTTVMLLGAALGALGVARRFIKS
jgi:hypothetical protein